MKTILTILLTLSVFLFSGCTNKNKDKQKLKSPCVSREGPCNWKPLNSEFRTSKV